MTRKKDNLKDLDDLVNKIKKDPQVSCLTELLVSSVDAFLNPISGKPLKKKQELKK